MNGHLRLFAFFLFIGLFVSACSSTPVKRQEDTAKDLVDLRQGLAATRAEVDKVLSSQNALMNASGTGLRDAYATYAKDVDDITKQAASVQKESRQMKRRRDAWLSGWQNAYNNIQDPELRTISEGRRSQVIARFDTVDGSYAAARDALDPFIQNLQDVKRAVSNDLTPNGIQAVASSGVVQNANAAGSTATRAIDVALNDLDALINALSASTPR